METEVVGLNEGKSLKSILEADVKDWKVEIKRVRELRFEVIRTVRELRGERESSEEDRREGMMTSDVKSQ